MDKGSVIWNGLVESEAFPFNKIWSWMKGIGTFSHILSNQKWSTAHIKGIYGMIKEHDNNDILLYDCETMTWPIWSLHYDLRRQDSLGIVRDLTPG